jgi:HK97 family phage prohead protease
MRKLVIGSKEYEGRKLREFAQNGDEAVLRRAMDAEIKVVDGERALDFIISNGSVDRHGDTIAANGWKLKNFRKNPVVLWMHEHAMLPVGKALKVHIEDGKLKARVEFTPAGMARFNDAVFDMLAGGFLSATSVGFIALKYNFVDDPQRRFGIDFLEQELVEFSIVTVPANAEALIEGRALEPKPEPITEPKAAEAVAYSAGLARLRLSLRAPRAA